MQQDNTDKFIVDTEEITQDTRESCDPLQLVRNSDIDTADLSVQPDTLTSDEFSIDELRATADQFNSAFNAALHDLDNTRCRLADRSARINDLNDAIRKADAALLTLVESGDRQQEIHIAETERLNARIQEFEQQHSATLQQMRCQRNELVTRSSETSALNSQVKELTRTLKDRTESKRELEEMQTREHDEYDSKVTELATILRSAHMSSVTTRHSRCLVLHKNGRRRNDHTSLNRP